MKAIVSITQNALKYAQGGATTKHHNGWSETTGRKEIKFNWELKNLEKAAKESEVERIDSSTGFSIVYIDKATDVEYCIVYQRAAYKGKASHIIACITNNVSIANS